MEPEITISASKASFARELSRRGTIAGLPARRSPASTVITSSPPPPTCPLPDRSLRSDSPRARIRRSTALSSGLTPAGPLGSPCTPQRA